MIRMLAGLNIIGCDVVDVSPPYDSQEITTLAGAEIMYEMLSIMALQPLDKKPLEQHARPDARAKREQQIKSSAKAHSSHEEL
jgi:hypothetical protein